ncbi:DUF7620 family protein [Kitasatospora camelliae]|uniref:DUF7620 family protein n=1 Tax=Kitasatospora camelliae TaxID=3156397 RepID=UPI003B58709D
MALTPRWMRRLLCRRRSGVSLVRRTSRPTPGQRDATQALYRATCARDEAQRQTREVEATAARLRAVREANHFAELFRSSMEGYR